MVHVKCYAFGAPRVGNHSWAKEYNTAIPDTWCESNIAVQHYSRNSSAGL